MSAAAGAAATWTAALCWSICEIVLDHFSLTDIPPSPLKEALLKATSALISTITMAKHKETAAVAAAAESSALAVAAGGPPLSRPVVRRQVSSSQSASQSRTLSILRSLHSEMVSLYQSESASLVFTSYLQQLVDLLVASDELRPAPDRLVAHFHFSAELTLEEEKEKAKEEEEAAKAAKKATAPPVWTCAVCTFENAEAAPGCDMCGSPKPKAAKKAAGPGGADGSGSSLQAQDSSAMLHDMLSLIAGMRLLNGEVGVEESPAARAMLEAAWREVRRDQCNAEWPLGFAAFTKVDHAAAERLN